MINILLIITNCLLLLIIILIVLFNKKFIIKNKQINKSSEMHLIALKQFDIIIGDYKIRFNKELIELKRKFDLDKHSQTNSISAFDKKRDELVKKHVSMLISDLPDNMKQILSYYFTLESLVLNLYNKIMDI